MKSIVELTQERLIYYDRFNLSKNKPILTIHRFSVYKLRIIQRLYSSDYGEINFLIQDDKSPGEKCILYAILWQPNTISDIKYWREIGMDKELAGYVVNAFIDGYLKGNYKLTCK